MLLKTIKSLLVFIILSASLLAWSDDEQANKSFDDARTAEKNEDYSAAAKAYMAALIYADDPVLKSNALQGAARSYRKKKLYGDEFDCLERLAKEHLNRVNYTEVVDRQYEIADAFFAGHRDTILSWIPFITKEDRATEMYEIALANAPYSEKAPDARLRLGRIYLEAQRANDAIAQFQETIKLYPGTDAARFAFLELCNTYLQLSRKGDGDGAWAKLALESFDEFLSKFPEDPEAPWARRSREEVLSLIAKRLHGLGVYYYRMGKEDIAARYFATVVRDYTNSVDSAESEKYLAKIDKTYEPPTGDIPRKEHEVPVYSRSAIPQEHSPIIVVPENSDGKWLFPIRDLKSDIRRDSRESLPERKLDDDEL